MMTESEKLMENMKNRIPETEHLYAYRYSYEEIGKSISKTRYYNDNKKGFFVLYRNQAQNVDKTKRNTCFEVYHRGDDRFDLVCSSFIAEYLRSVGLDEPEYKKTWDLKYIFKIRGDSEIIRYCINIMRNYEKTYYQIEYPMDINIPEIPMKIDGDNVSCPNCMQVFIRAKRCPECGQLILYKEG